MTRDLDLHLDPGSGHTAHRHASLIPAYQILLKSKKLFCGRTDVRTDVRTYGRADGHLRPTLLGRLWEVDLVNYMRAAEPSAQSVLRNGVWKTRGLLIKVYRIFIRRQGVIGGCDPFIVVECQRIEWWWGMQIFADSRPKNRLPNYLP